MEGHIKTEHFKRERAECTFSFKRPFSTSVGKIGYRNSPRKFSFKSKIRYSYKGRNRTGLSCRFREHRLYSNEQKVVQKLRRTTHTVANPDGGNTKVLRVGEFEVLAKDVEGCTKP